MFYRCCPVFLNCWIQLFLGLVLRLMPAVWIINNVYSIWLSSVICTSFTNKFFGVIYHILVCRIFFVFIYNSYLHRFCIFQLALFFVVAISSDDFRLDDAGGICLKACMRSGLFLSFASYLLYIYLISKIFCKYLLLFLLCILTSPLLLLVNFPNWFLHRLCCQSCVLFFISVVLVVYSLSHWHRLTYFATMFHFTRLWHFQVIVVCIYWIDSALTISLLYTQYCAFDSK